MGAIIRLLCLSLMLILSVGCHPADTETGSIAVRAIWPSPAEWQAPTPHRLAPRSAVPAQAKTVRVRISATDMTPIKQDFPVEAHRGVISNVPAGSDRLLILQALNSAGDLLADCKKPGLLIEAGKTTQAGDCLFKVVGSAQSKADAALVALFESLGGDYWKKGGPTDNDPALRWVTGPNHCEWFGVICDESGKVISIDLDANNLTGELPDDIGDFCCLVTLSLDNNGISGEVPGSIANLASLERLSLHSNKLQGAIPSKLADLETLISIDVDYNALYVAKDAGAGVQTALEQKHGSNFLETQTLDARNLEVVARTQTSLTFQWDQSLYPKEEGGYRIYISDNSDGPFIRHTEISGTGVDKEKGEVVGKANTKVEVEGLKSGKLYYFIVRSFTNPHENNQNLVESDGKTGNVALGITDSDDSDLDGLKNVDEERIGTNPNNHDSDGDGVFDLQEVVDPSNPADTDKDGLIDALDPDDDSDGVPTRQEVIIPDDPNKSAGFKDTDEDGIPHHLDADEDGDGVPTFDETDGGTNIDKDTDGDGIPDYLDPDDDDDGTSTFDETDGGKNIDKDSDGDGIPDYLDLRA